MLWAALATASILSAGFPTFGAPLPDGTEEPTEAPARLQARRLRFHGRSPLTRGVNRQGALVRASLEPNADSANPSAQAAPMLDLTSLTAQDGDTTLVAEPIDAETGSGF